MNHILFIEQILPTECGVACVAMLGGVSLPKARKLIKFPNQSDQKTTQREIRLALQPLGKFVGRKVGCLEKDKLQRLAKVALVAVNYKVKGNGEINWHWLVYDNSDNKARILDPNKSKERISWATTKIKWFHHVYDAPHG